MLHKSIAVLTSGGDAPGMNALLYAMAKACENCGISLLGITEGFKGLCQTTCPVNILHSSDLENYRIRGGTYLGTSRWPLFLDDNVQKKAAQNLNALAIDRLLVIGGEGSYHGAKAIAALGAPVFCIPASIDNDVPGTEVSIGFFSALESTLSALENLRVTAASHHRIFLVEIMGNLCGDLTRLSGLLGYASFSIIDPKDFSEHNLIARITLLTTQHRQPIIVCIAEKICNVFELAKKIELTIDSEVRASVLGHLQRGGDASIMDRLVAAQLGHFAVHRATCSDNGIEFLGMNNGEPTFSPDPDQLENAKKRFLSSNFLNYARFLSQTN